MACERRECIMEKKTLAFPPRINNNRVGEREKQGIVLLRLFEVLKRKTNNCTQTYTADST